MFGNLQQIKIQLGINPQDPQEDALLNILMVQASSAIEEWCNRTFQQATYTEFYSGDGTPELALNQRPVSSVASIYLDDNGWWGQSSNAFGSTTLLTQGTDYALEIDQPDGSSRCGLVQNINGYWPRPICVQPNLISPFPGVGNGNIKVTYTAGYSVIPPKIQLALFLQIATIRNSKNYGVLLASESQSDTAGSNSYSAALKSVAGMMTPEVLSLLASYREMSMA